MPQQLLTSAVLPLHRLAALLLAAASAGAHAQSSVSYTVGTGVAAGSLLGALLAGVTPFSPGQAFVLSFVACVAGSLGHLVMKAIKRDRGIPNWGLEGDAVTGTGGLLDRVDALCFAAPVFFHSVRWYFQL